MDAGLLPVGHDADAINAATPSLEIRGADATSPQPEPSNSAQLYHGSLNGVNQPMNMVFKDAIWWMLGGLALAFLVIRIGQLVWSRLRLVTAMSVPREKQGYWKRTQWDWMPDFKKHVLYAPLFSKRHNRELRISSAVNVGTLPSRFHSLVLFVYLATNLAYMLVLDYTVDNKFKLYAELRGRSGTLAAVNMVPLIIFAGRNNPLIGLLCISFDTYNLLHRWMGRIVVIESVIHTCAWAVVASADMGFNAAMKSGFERIFLCSGWVGTIAMVLLLLSAFGPVRHAFYETFLSIHIFLALAAFIATLIHCITSTHPGGLPQLPWLIGILGIWALERIARLFRLVYNNWSRSQTTYAICEPMPCEVTRVTMHLPRYVDVKPGTHAYLRFWGLNAWENHPFSIAWVDHRNHSDGVLPVSEKEPLSGIDKSTATTTVSFLIGAQTGMTRKLFEAAKQGHGKGMGGNNRSIQLKAAFEGPYAGHHSLDSYGHSVLFAGSTGITHQLSYIRHLLEGYNAGTVATRRLTLVWIVREYEALEWVRPYMDSVLRIPHRKDILRIQVFVTRPQNPRDISSASTTVRMFPGRPNIPMLLVKEVQEQVGAMCVTVCGPGALADDVRGAVRAVQGDTVVDFVEESFTW